MRRFIRIPGFPIYESMIRFLGAKPVPIPLVEERGFSFDLDVFRASLTDQTKMVVLNSPQNPTGGVIPHEDIARHRGAGARPRPGGAVATRFIRAFTTTAMRRCRLPACRAWLEKTIILDGFSKTYAMTGWRLGYGVMPRVSGGRGEQADGEFEFVHGDVYADGRDRGAARVRRTTVDAMVAEFRRRRDAFCAALNEVPGWRCGCRAGRFMRSRT